jgi:hypothetical protein
MKISVAKYHRCNIKFPNGYYKAGVTGIGITEGGISFAEAIGKLIIKLVHEGVLIGIELPKDETDIIEYC